MAHSKYSKIRGEIMTTNINFDWAEEIDNGQFKTISIVDSRTPIDYSFAIIVDVLSEVNDVAETK